MLRNNALKAAAAALTVLMLSSCGADKPVTESGFLFDTYTSFTVSGKDGKATMKELKSGLEQLDSAFKLCYGTEASALPENKAYSECIEKSFALNDIYGDSLNVTCGALTELWGISTPTPRVPSDTEIKTALQTIIYDINEDSRTDSIDNNTADTKSDSITDILSDIKKGTRIDFGAVSKGYACDEAYSLLEESAADYAVINLSSTTLMYGSKPDGSKFRAGVTDPFTGSGFAGIIETDSAFVSTSGGYERYFEAEGERYCHILDITTGRPVETDLASVTVIVPSEIKDGGMLSDYLSTMIYIEGTENIEKWLAYDEFELIAIDSDRKIYTDCGGFTPEEKGGYSYAG